MEYFKRKTVQGMLKVNLEDVKKAEEVLKSIVKETPLQESKELSAKLGANVYYKCENLQKTGSFKINVCPKFSTKLFTFL